MATAIDRKGQLDLLWQLTARYGADPDGWELDFEHAEPGVLAWALVESNARYSDPPAWLTLHSTAKGALAYNREQEYAADWDVALLVDLRTGERFEADSLTAAMSR